MVHLRPITPKDRERAEEQINKPSRTQLIQSLLKRGFILYPWEAPNAPLTKVRYDHPSGLSATLNDGTLNCFWERGNLNDGSFQFVSFSTTLNITDHDKIISLIDNALSTGWPVEPKQNQ